MGKFQRGGGFNRKSGNRGYGRSGGFGGDRDRGFGDKKVFDAVCADCGNDCTVPFKPNGKKPVLCRDCFKKVESYEPRGDYGPSRRSFDGGRDRDRGPRSGGAGNKRELEEINRKLDRILDILGQNEEF